MAQIKNAALGTDPSSHNVAFFDKSGLANERRDSGVIVGGYEPLDSYEV